MDLGLANKRVLITAGAAGIGRAVAEHFIAEGAKVLVCDIDEEAIRSVRATTGIFAVSTDVSKSEAVAELFVEVDRQLGGLDILINNAGTSGPSKPLEAVSDEEWRATLAVNLDGSFFCARSAVPRIKEAGGGSVVNISSVAGLLPFAKRIPYCTAKYGVIGLTEVMARELGPHNINVNAICPGNVDSPRAERVNVMAAQSFGLSVEQIRQAVLDQTSMRRLVSVSEIAGMIAYLCSPQARIISGQSIAIDGQTTATEF
ncbi:NAD(P)-dependent dehydrogenase (short-subunit alcohol dehydrogenase family) [Sinorhizobium kostiense]|uniref:NAD(P)-dependent dehydrogenase (Short-subunit alcohol dehydrogenase family) n=1 Tax=Sinorhizobium kostiense TaxID=76747 RepID=A0ABS4R939_9HYPH|nr:SDR family oxidoreductase [Sinorhizobium kostiense]MBP2239405.1 NAD(P)-dependent dehydrogenase (short-subunit alcohol dehydrogenase family) [Sinorhizobium kostiense]